MTWEAFLRKIADDFGLSSDQTKVFLIRFNEEHKNLRDTDFRELLGHELEVSSESYSKYKTKLYSKFEWGKQNPDGCQTLKKAGSHKHKCLLEWLETKFEQECKAFGSFPSEHNVTTAGVLDWQNWRKIGRDFWEAQEKHWLSSHPLGSANRRVKDVYVPLGLIERKQEQPRHRSRDIAPDNFSVPKQEQVETLKPVSHDEFFDGVLQGHSPKSAGQRIVVVGEPGAGKTTLLQKIASQVDGLAIWVDLASLQQGDSLEGYLLEWLRRAQIIIGQYAPKMISDPSSKPLAALRQQFTTLFGTQPIWLLLDGADEMASELGQPLNWIAQQLRLGGWWTQARVVLTCRLNVWSVGGDRLSPTFDVYRNLDFEPEDVTEFIEKWFIDEPETIKNFQAEIERASDRMKSLIRNPLRLTLLCRTWKGLGDKLPETKAGLYQRLVNAHYEWKKDNPEFAIARSVRAKLDKKLGELAKRAIDRPESRFRLRESFILEDEEWGYPDESGSLFWWAIKLGWLNQIGLPDTSETNADDLVYAFFHPTFQEYFAALFISDWEHFLPKINNGLPTQSSNCDYHRYRIFEWCWQESILFWLGLDKVNTTFKEHFIDTLIRFEDGCGGFYRFQAILFASKTLREFPSKYEEDILDILLCWSLDITEQEDYTYFSVPKVIQYLARESVISVNPYITIIKLISFLKLLKEGKLYRDHNRLYLKCLSLLPRVIIGNNIELDSLLMESDWVSLDEFDSTYILYLFSSNFSEDRNDVFDIDLSTDEIEDSGETINAIIFFESVDQILSIIDRNTKIDIISGLIFNIREQDSIFSDAELIMWHLSRSLAYPLFWEAWHKSIQDSNSE